MSKADKNKAREREIARRSAQGERPREARLPDGQVASLPQGAVLVEEHREWSFHKNPTTGVAYIKVVRKDGGEQIYRGQAAFVFYYLSLGQKRGDAAKNAKERQEVADSRGKKLFLEALRPRNVEQAMNDPLGLYVLDNRVGGVRNIYEALPSEFVVMVVNCLDGTPTRLFGLEQMLAGEEPLTFSRQDEPDGTVVVAFGSSVLDLYFAPDLTDSQRNDLRKRADRAQAAFGEEEDVESDNELLTVLRQQHREAKVRGEVEPLRDWCSSLALSAVISMGMATLDGAIYSAEVINEALPLFHKETGGIYE